MNLTVSNTNRILRSGNGPTVEYTGQDPIQVNNATHIISLNSAFSAQFAESGVEAKVDELSSCCEQVHSSISSLETQVSSLSSTVETQISALSSTIEAVSSELPDFATKEWVNDQGYLTQIPDGYLTKAEAEVTYQPIGNYLTSADIANKLDVSALEYTDQGKISAYNGGTTYTPGQYISIDSNNEISVTGLQPEGDYATNTDLQTVSSDLKDLIPSTDEFLTKASADTLYQPIGDYLTSEDITGFATRDEVSSYLLKEEFKETSSFLQTEISSLSAIVTSATDDYELIEGDYIKLTDNSANHTTEISVTGLPNFSDYASTGDLNALSSLVDNLSGDVSSISSTVSSSVTSLSSDITYVSANCLTAHQSLDDYYKKTETSSKQEISAALASLQPGDPEVNQVVHTYSAEGKWLIASDLDPYLQKSESGNFYPMTGNPSGFLTSETDWTNTIKEASANAYNEAVAQIPAPFDPTYLSGEIDKKLDKSFSSNFYPMTGNPSGFLTAHQSLAGYATTAEVDTVSSILSAGLEYVSANGGKTYTGVSPIVVNNDEVKISAETWDLSAGNGISFTDFDEMGITRLDVTGTFDNIAVNQVVKTYSAAGKWLTAHQSLDNYYQKTDTSSKQEISAALTALNNDLSAAIDYVSANGGKTYTGVAPIQVNNTTDQISITGQSLSAGPNIDIFASGGYVVISAQGGNSFPITGSKGTTAYTANVDCSSVLLTTASSPAGGYVKQTVQGVQYEAYPATNVSASWNNIINAANNRSNCYCIRFTNEMTAADLANYSAYDKVTVVHSNEYTQDCNLYWDGNTKVFPSGLYCELVKGTNDRNQTDWFFTTSGWTNNLWWDWD